MCVVMYIAISIYVCGSIVSMCKLNKVGLSVWLAK